MSGESDGDMPELLVRDAVPADREAIRRVTWAAYAELEAGMGPEAWHGLHGAVAGVLARKSGEWIVCDAGGRIVGSVMLSPPATEAYGGFITPPPWPEIRVLAVDPAMRGYGIARTLVAECIRRAAAAGAARIGLHTSRSMHKAIALYLKMGFQRAPSFDFQPPGAELVEAYVLPTGI
jgi:ribosomal protein S18 acetylase RimI-like enzyme